MPQVGVDWKTLLVDWRTLQEEGRPAGLLRMLHALLLICMCVCVFFLGCRLTWTGGGAATEPGPIQTETYADAYVSVQPVW